jgi:hypothetical protein
VSRGARLLLVFLLAGAAALQAGPAEVVVLKGGARIELKKPAERRGDLILLTRADGTLLSVRDSEIDWKATADLRAARAPSKSPSAAVTAPPESPAQAARLGREGPRAKVKLTDADVQHVGEEGSSEAGEKKPPEQAGGARLEVAEYAQEKSGPNVIVRGELRNIGGAPALNSRMTVTAMDEKGEKVATAEAGLSNGMIAPGASVSFSVTIPVGEKLAASLRFSPQWIAPAAPAPAVSPAAAAPAARPAPANPTPVPTPFGQGSLYAPAAAPASTTPSADGSRGYISGMSSPENQPQPLVTPKPQPKS